MIFQVAKTSLHPNFSDIDLSNDIAIIRLSNHAIFNNFVRPVCLWQSNKIALSEVIGRDGTVVGFRKTENGTLSNELREAFMPVESFWKCLRSDPSFYGYYLSETNFCAGLRNGSWN